LPRNIKLDDAVRCRTYGHAWDEFFPDDLGVPMYGWRLSLRCTRCLTERHDIVERTGAIGGRRYIYPEGYKMAGYEKPTREQMRLVLFASVRSQLVKANAINEEMREVS
jgi:hypothetical protein